MSLRPVRRPKRLPRRSVLAGRSKEVAARVDLVARHVRVLSPDEAQDLDRRRPPEDTETTTPGRITETAGR